jgi:hypothetical protein
LDAGGNIAFDDRGRPVPAVDFDFAAVDPAAVIEDLHTEIENLRRDLAYARSKVPEVVDLIFEILLSQPHAAEQMKRRMVALAFIMERTTFKTQAELAQFLGTTPQAVSKQVDSICSRSPLLARLRTA